MISPGQQQIGDKQIIIQSRSGQSDKLAINRKLFWAIRRFCCHRMRELSPRQTNKSRPYSGQSNRKFSNQLKRLTQVHPLTSNKSQFSKLSCQGKHGWTAKSNFDSANKTTSNHHYQSSHHRLYRKHK
jgi:hypothetical protein